MTKPVKKVTIPANFFKGSAMQGREENPVRSITGVYPILRFAIDRGIRTELLLDGTGLGENDFLDPQNDILLEQELCIIRNLIAHVPEPEMIWTLGGYFTTKAHGVLGSLMASAPTVGDMMSSVIDYSQLGHSFFKLYPEKKERIIRVFLVERYHTGTLLTVLIERDIMAGISALETRLPGRKNDIITAISFAHAPRASTRKYREAFVKALRFQQPVPFFDLARSSLSMSIADGDDQRFKLIRQQCRTEFSLRAYHRFFLSDKVRLLLQAGSGKPSQADVADQLHMSERSFRRELRKEGGSFRRIRDQIALQKSQQLLRDSDLHIDEIAGMLGYSEARAFIRAFRKWTGMSPGQCRKQYNNELKSG